MRHDKEPYIYRRHALTCSHHGPGGRGVRSDQCRCPFHADGIYRGQRIRRSLNARSRQAAERHLAEALREIDLCVAGDGQLTLAEAARRFLQGIEDDVESSTLRKYRTKLRLLEAYCTKNGVTALAAITGDVLTNYRQSRKVASITWRVELQAFRTFFNYGMTRKWVSSNPAREIRPPQNIKPNQVVPYTLGEEAKILAACDEVGGTKYRRSQATYERLRVRAMIMLLRATALRVSDVCLLRKDAVLWDAESRRWRLHLRTLKSGEPVFLPITAELKLALDALPLPRGAAADCPYFFWNETTSQRAVVGIAERALATVFKRSGVPNAHAHRFRHTLATRLLGQGATFEQVADILGNSPAVVRKHYAKWSKARQDNIDRLMLAHFDAAQDTVPVALQSH